MLSHWPDISLLVEAGNLELLLRIGEASSQDIIYGWRARCGVQVFRALDDVEDGAGEAGCARRAAASEDDAFDPKRSPHPAVHGSRRRCLQVCAARALLGGWPEHE